MRRTTTYIWQREDWPCMTWDHASFGHILAEVNMLRGKLLGRVSMFGFEEQNQSMLDSLTQEIVHHAGCVKFLGASRSERKVICASDDACAFLKSGNGFLYFVKHMQH